MFYNSKEICIFSFYCGFICSLIGKYWNFGFFCWFLGIVLFSVVFVLLFMSYYLLKKGVLFVYEKFVKIFPEVLQEDEKKEREKKDKNCKQI